MVFDILPENRAMLALARRVGAGPMGFDGRSVLYGVAIRPLVGEGRAW